MPLPAYWERFTYNGNVRQEVGYQPEILDYVWQNYGVVSLLFQYLII